MSFGCSAIMTAHSPNPTELSGFKFGSCRDSLSALPAVNLYLEGLEKRKAKPIVPEMILSEEQMHSE